MKKLAPVFVLLVAGGNANASLVNIDFQPSASTTYSGQGILGTAANTIWNSVDTGGAVNLTFADGSLSTIGITTSFDSSFSNLPGATNELLADRLFGSNPLASQSVTITGLAANSQFDIVLYNGFYAQEYSVNGQAASTDPVAAGSSSNSFPNWTSGVEYATLSGVMSDFSGSLAIMVTPLDGITDVDPPNSAIAGLQIQAVSAVTVPATLWLFLSALGGGP